MTPDKTVDKCKFCGREIIYDQEDGYWDSFEKQVGPIKHYTPFCDKREEGYTHESINHLLDEKGHYHPIK